jgi:hypothetical protein
VKKSLLILPLALLAAALALTACGGGGSSSGSTSSGAGGEEGVIEEVIIGSATDTDPASCTELQTEEFTEQEQGTTGKAAVEQCEKGKENEENVSEAVTVSNIKIEGESATAEAKVEGSGLNGQTLELELTKEEGDWKLAHFAGFAKFDSAALAKALEEELENQPGVQPAEVKCLGEAFGGLSQEEAESVAFEKNLELVEEVIQSCK